METIAGETGWDGLAHSSLMTSGGPNLTSSVYSGDFASLNSSRSGGSYFWIVAENATTSPPHAVPEPRMRDLGLARAEIGVLGLVLALTTLGNSFILWVLLRRKKQNAPMHIFMVNLCVADLVVALFQVLPQLVWDITEKFQGPDLLCRSVKYLQIVGMFASSYMIVAMTVDRHYAICCPLQAYRGGAVSRWNTPVMVAWVLALVLSIPQVFIFSRSEVSPGEFECWGHFAETWGLKAYVTWMTVAVFVLPALIITVCQVRIFREIHNNIYLKTERMVSAELKNNAVLFRFQTVKKEDERVRERGRGASGAGREGRGHLLMSADNPSGSHSNPIAISPGGNPDCYDYLPHVSQHSGCHGARHAAPQPAFSSPDDDRPPGPGPGDAKTPAAAAPPCDGSHGNGCYCESYEIPTGSPRPSVDYLPPLPLAPPPPSITKAMSKTVRMTLVIVLVYTVCWSPFFIVQLWAAWDPDPPDQGVAFTILMLLASLNSCTNPWIYTAFSSSVSRELQALLGCRPRASRRGSLYDDSTTTHTSTTGHKDSLY